MYLTGISFFPQTAEETRSTLKGERGADLVARLVKLSGVEGEAKAKGRAGVEFCAVGESGDAAVVDLGLESGCSVSMPTRGLQGLTAYNIPWRN